MFILAKYISYFESIIEFIYIYKSALYVHVSDSSVLPHSAGPWGWVLRSETFIPIT